MDELLTFTPGQYTEDELKKLAEKTAEVETYEKRGTIDLEALINGTLPDNVPVYSSGAPAEVVHSGKAGRLITREDMLLLAKTYNPYNPLFNDEEYANKSKWGGLYSMPSIEVAGFMPKMPEDMGDNMVVSGLNHTLTFHRPIRAGDRLFRVQDTQGWRDITIPGSPYRTFQVFGTGRTYNQRGELVSEGASICKESFSIYADSSQRTGGNCWESPDWWKQRPAHVYTDNDWEKIAEYWKNEKIRGASTLYWQDVKPGDELIPTLDGPVISEAPAAGLVDDVSTIAMREQYLDPVARKKMRRDEFGIYHPILPPEKPKNEPPMGEPGQEPPPMPKEGKRSTQKLSDGRFVFMNTLAKRFAERMITNWMGDEGFIRKISWCIMPVVYGYDGLIPDHDRMPEQFDKIPYFHQVPALKNRRADVHGLAGDVSINKAVVTGKYYESGKYLVDLIWWCETITGHIFQEGAATVELPCKD